MQQRLPKRSTRSWQAVLLAVLLVSFWGSSAHGIGLDGISAAPADRPNATQPWFVYYLSPGEQAADNITINNANNQARTVSVYAVDAVPTNNNGFGMMAQGVVPTDAGAWIVVPTRSVTIPARSQRTVPFSFSVPATASVGQHYGGIIVQPEITQNTSSASGTQVTVVPRIGVRIYETVPGKQRPSLVLGELEIDHRSSSIAAAIAVHNNGNTILSPVGTLTVRNSLGRTVDTKTLATGEPLQPGGQAVLHTTSAIPAHLPQHYTMTVTFEFAGSHHVSQKSALWLNTTPLIVASVLLFAAMFFTIRGFKRPF